MAKNTFRCRLITPDAEVLNEPVTSVVLPAHDGLMGILPQRAPMVAQLGTGELRIDFPDRQDAKGGSRVFFVDDGFAQMLGDQLTILAANAVAAEAINETEAQAEVNELRARNVETMTVDAVENLRKQRERAAAKLRTAKTFRAQGGGI